MFLYYICLFVEIVVFEMVCGGGRIVLSCSSNVILQDMDLSVLLH